LVNKETNNHDSRWKPEIRRAYISTVKCLDQFTSRPRKKSIYSHTALSLQLFISSDSTNN